jgi:hypothetical protein
LAWRERNPANAGRAFERVIELLDLTSSDPKHRGRLRELARLRETMVDFFAFDNERGAGGRTHAIRWSYPGVETTPRS